MNGVDRMEQDREINMNNNNFRGMQNRFLERDFFEKNTRDIDYTKQDENNNNIHSSAETNVGEITGQGFSTSELEYGMPIRSAHYGKKIQRNTVTTGRSDFDLFNESSC